MDTLYIRDLHVTCVVGVDAEERLRTRPLTLNLALECDLAPGLATDRIDDTLDYRALTQRIVCHVAQTRFQLIEALAESVAQACLAAPRVHAVRVTVDKPGALPEARSVAVEIRRSRAEPRPAN